MLAFMMVVQDLRDMPRGGGIDGLAAVVLFVAMIVGVMAVAKKQDNDP